MIKHKKVYIDFFNYDQGDVILCEVCEHNFYANFGKPKTGPEVIREAVDIHHIKARGMGSSKCDNINEIHNLIAVCRECHIKAEDNKDFNKRIRIIHLKNVIKQLENG